MEVLSFYDFDVSIFRNLRQCIYFSLIFVLYPYYSVYIFSVYNCNFKSQCYKKPRFPRSEGGGLIEYL